MRDLSQNCYTWLTSIEHHKRQSFFKALLNKLNPLQAQLKKYVAIKTFNEYDEQLSTLKLLCNTDFNQKPLDFAEKFGGDASKSEDFYLDNYEELLVKATELIKLSSDERSKECKDVIILELPMKVLKGVELWDIPGFDENETINNRIKEILEDTDLIFVLIPHQESVRMAFQNFIQPRLEKQENDNTNFELNANNRTSIVCFIVTQIDTFKPNIQTNRSRDDVLTNLFITLGKYPNIKFNGNDMKSCNNFIPMCTHRQFGIKTFLECRQMFIEKSSRWFQNAIERLAHFRLRYLLNVMQQIIQYSDIKLKSQQCKELQHAFLI
ncbi:unnamed protein product [Adineta ricciae]|uniref:Uncharacterized protein n=1 Tax=Adineta ricciae TaxID=249248 RepID=A0A815P492_ADIRI|nr:unnamed protein product [Adineta ricciae]CAF1589704.1 unnamed protein product [Adineta ricciae]